MSQNISLSDTEIDFLKKINTDRDEPSNGVTVSIVLNISKGT